MLLLLLVVGVGEGAGLTPFFRASIGERLGDRPFPGVALHAASSFSGDGDEPAPVAELRLELGSPTVVSKWRNL